MAPPKALKVLHLGDSDDFFPRRHRHANCCALSRTVSHEYFSAELFMKTSVFVTLSHEELPFRSVFTAYGPRLVILSAHVRISHVNDDFHLEF